MYSEYPRHELPNSLFECILAAVFPGDHSVRGLTKEGPVFLRSFVAGLWVDLGLGEEPASGSFSVHGAVVFLAADVPHNQIDPEVLKGLLKSSFL